MFNQLSQAVPIIVGLAIFVALCITAGKIAQREDKENLRKHGHKHEHA